MDRQVEAMAPKRSETFNFLKDYGIQYSRRYAAAIAQIALCLHLECRGEPLIGKQAVASVIVNRARKRGMSYVDVMAEPWQFSCFNAIDSVDVKHSEIDIECWTVASQVVYGLLDDITFGATHYCNLAVLDDKPTWAVDELITVRIENHTFYSLY